jgi:hypothetical protein
VYTFAMQTGPMSTPHTCPDAIVALAALAILLRRFQYVCTRLPVRCATWIVCVSYREGCLCIIGNA